MFSTATVAHSFLQEQYNEINKPLIASISDPQIPLGSCESVRALLLMCGGCSGKAQSCSLWDMLGCGCWDDGGVEFPSAALEPACVWETAELLRLPARVSLLEGKDKHPLLPPAGLWRGKQVSYGDNYATGKTAVTAPSTTSGVLVEKKPC